MTIRETRPVQYVITLNFKGALGQPFKEVVRYGFGSEPSAFKVKMVARSIEQGIVRTIPGLTFQSYEAKRV